MLSLIQVWPVNGLNIRSRINFTCNFFFWFCAASDLKIGQFNWEINLKWISKLFAWWNIGLEVTQSSVYRRSFSYNSLFSGDASFGILAKIFEIEIPIDNSFKTRLRLIQVTQVHFFFNRERHICDYWRLIYSAWTT